ncbi:hypothetical protein LCGC14_2465830, partial [marine sediment metagenome]
MKPTLEEQIAVSKLSDDECIKLLCPSGLNFWLYRKLPFVWRLVRWNWFNIWTEDEGFVLFLKHGFREWKEVKR